MLSERVQVLNEAGKAIQERFHGSFSNAVRDANNSAQVNKDSCLPCVSNTRTQALVRLITDACTSYKDEAEFAGRHVKVHKRVQILVADLWACFEGEGLGEFHDIDSVTMFADYR